MNLKKIKEEIQAIVDDTAFDANLTDFVNAAYVNAVIEAGLPEYKKAGTVTTSIEQNFVDLGAEIDGFGKIIKVMPPAGKSVEEKDSLEELITEATVLGVIETEIKAIAVEGTILWYRPIASPGQVLTLLYQAGPDPLTSNSDEITLFPDLIQRKICVNGACAACFEKIEDALEAPEKLNTLYHRKMYEEGKRELKEWNARRRKHISKSRWEV